MKTNFNEFLNESRYDTTELIENCERLKKIYYDYIDVRLLFKNIGEYFYGKLPTEFGTKCGFGFCNDSKSQFTLLFKDIASNLIDNDFNLDLDYLEKYHQIPYYQHRIEQFINYLEERPHKKYYYYQTTKKKLWDDKFTPEEKMEYIKQQFDKSTLKEKYDISINAPVSFINVELVEK